MIENTPVQYHDASGLADLKRLARADQKDAIGPVAQQFESVFLKMMLKSMRDTVPEGGLFSGGDMEFYQEMMDNQLAVTLSESGGVGLAPIIERQLGGAEKGAADAQPQTAEAAALRAQLSLSAEADDDVR